MENKIAVIAIIVENPDVVAELNEILHEFSESIIGRMGIPYRAKKLSLISIALDAPKEVIDELTGKLSQLDQVTVQTAYSHE
ncbi:MAG: iron-only hydrogenase system regulator [Solobacterium sp.]|nr:iron-only hydrogenase system regulator [Solobacterium sp.]